MSIPNDLKYTSDHEWLRDEGAVVVVGVTAHAQEQLGDVVFVDLPAVGATVKQGSSFGTVESVKAVNDLYAPVSGTVVAINEQLANEAVLVNQDPYGKGWMIKIKPTSNAEMRVLLSPADYQKMLGG
jgi:glycine cleavage system H protein